MPHAYDYLKRALCSFQPVLAPAPDPRDILPHILPNKHILPARLARLIFVKDFFVRHNGCWCPATCFATENCQHVEKKFCLASRPDIGAGANPDFNLMTLINLLFTYQYQSRLVLGTVQHRRVAMRGEQNLKNWR